MVEIFTKRIELMPADESIEQHNTKRAEEVADVEKDRNGPLGLFKGIFPKKRQSLLRDEADGVLRCPNCNHEYEGGVNCSVCDTPVDLDDSSDMDEDDLDSPMSPEGPPPFYDLDAMGLDHHFAHHHRHHIVNTDSEFTSESSDDEDEGSMRDFVAPDDEVQLQQDRIRQASRGTNTEDDSQTEDEDESPPHRSWPRNREVVTILSDDDSDEGGEVISRRSRRRNVAPSMSPSVLTVTDGSTDGSEVGDMHSEADRLRTAGWSPLDHGNDSDAEVQEMYGYGSPLDGNDSDEDSDTNTETMQGNIPSDDDDRDDMSDALPDDADNYSGYGRYHPEVYEHIGDDGYDSTDEPEMPVHTEGETEGEEDSDEGSTPGPSLMLDRDGDTEMSASPDARRSTSVSTNPYRNDSRQSSVSYASDFQGFRGQSVSTNGDANNYQYRAENLGAANQVLDEQDDSSDASIRPPARRRRPRYNVNARVQQYDPRISMLFADHQQVQQGEGPRSDPVELEEMEVGTIEPASRHRRTTAYRRQTDLLRDSRSPSASRVVASSSRGARTRRSARERSYN